MFGFRNDGKRVKPKNIIDRAEPFFMNQRIDAVNYINIKIPCDKLDEFIQRERRNGVNFTYMHLVITAIVRLLYTREKFNRFIMRGDIYQRKGIFISLDVKKDLTDEGEQVTVKFEFTGRESIYEVKEIVDNEIAKSTAKDNVHKTTKFISGFTKLPSWMFRWAMASFRFLDRHGMLPKFAISASPFHTSCFLTNLKSIKLKYIYHHLYNFGTTSMFVAMGKEQMEPIVVNNKDLSIAKIMNFGVSLDERVADGLYMAKSLKLFEKMLANPDSLTEKMPDDGTIPKKLAKVKKVKTKKQKEKKTKKVKEKKEKKPKKIKPLKNKEKALKRAKKSSKITTIERQTSQEEKSVE